MQDIESAVQDLGDSALQGVDQAVKGLSSLSIEGTLPFLIGILILFIIVKVFSLPFKLVWNGVYGAIALWLINLLGSFLGFGIKVTIVKALIAGFFGIPGCLAVILWELYVR